MFEACVLPDEWPATRQKKKRSANAGILPPEAVEPEIMEIAIDHTGERRKELVQAIGSFYGIVPAYQNAPTFAYCFGEYEVYKLGTLTAPMIPA